MCETASVSITTGDNIFVLFCKMGKKRRRPNNYENDFDLVANENILFSGGIEEGEDTIVPIVSLDITTTIQLIFT